MSASKKRMQNGMRPIHPGKVLLEEYLKPLKLTPRTFATRFGLVPDAVTALLRGEVRVDARRALTLAHALGTTPEFWMNLQSAYDLQVARLDVDLMALVRAHPPIIKR